MNNCDCNHQSESEEKESKLFTIISFAFGLSCLVTAFILNKVDSEFDEISWELFSNSNFISSYSFISFILYTVGYLICLIGLVKECIEEFKEGEIFNENLLMIIATAGAYAICEFPEAIFVALFNIIGELLEDYATNKSRKSIKSLVNNMALYAHKVDGEEIIDVDPKEVKIDDILEIRPGEKVAIDGIIVKGSSSVDLSSLNGESLPKQLNENEYIYSGSIVLDSVIQIKAIKEFKDSTLSRIMNLVEEEREAKAKSEKFITKFAKYYTPIVMLITLLIFIIGYGLSGFTWLGENGGKQWLYRALSILLISCPCALVIAVPIGFFAGIGKASKLGFLLKGSQAIEKIANSNAFIFDKTGTITEGKFKLLNDVNDDNLLIAASIESKSSHPIANAILEANTKELLPVSNYLNVPGRGLKATVSGKEYLIGNLDLFIENNFDNLEKVDTPYKVLYLGCEGKIIEHFIVADKIKGEAKTTFENLKKSKVKKNIILSGDDKNIVDEVGKEINADEYYGQLLPEEKLAHIKELNKSYKTCFVGDGINDSPSLLAANVGVSMGSLGSDAAIEASDIVIMDDNLNKVYQARELSKRTMRTIIFGIILAIFIKVLVMVLVAVGVLGKYAMIIAAISDTGAMAICVLNALTILLYKHK